MLPEFMRSLRGFAAPEALESADHARIFAPLLSARKTAARVETAEGRLAAFDATRLHKALTDAIAVLGAEHVRSDGGERRALVALLTEMAVPMFLALTHMAAKGSAFRTAGETTRDAAWSTWVAAVQSLFDETDRFWLAANVVLGALPPVKRRRPHGASSLRAVAAIVFVGAALVFFAAPLRAQHVTVRVPVVRPETLLAHGFDVVGSDAAAALVVVDPSERARMESLGWRGTEVLVTGGAAFQARTTPVVFRSYDDPARGVRRFVDSIVANNPRVSVDTIGRSFEGRPMLAVKVGPRGDSPARPNVLFMATYHAREWAATEMALRLIKYLAAPSSGNARVDSLVQSRDIWIMPVANPDGYEYTFTADRLWRKTRSPQASGAFGVDMNRNHRQRWGLDNTGSSNQPSSEVYRGPSPASEIETRNIEAFHASHPPVTSVSYHTYAGLLLYPPGSIYAERPADLPVYQTLAGTNAKSAVIDHLPGSARSFYSPSNGWMLYTTNGDYNDWASSQYSTLSFTPELTSGYTFGAYYGFEFPDDEALLQKLFDDNLPFALDVIESARDPFGWSSPTTGSRPDRVVLESISPDVRVTVPSAAVSQASINTGSAIPFRVDSSAGGRYTRRLISVTNGKPLQVSVSTGSESVRFTVLASNGAELAETGWVASGFKRDSAFLRSGKYSWQGAAGELRSPSVHVPADVDTVSLVFWTRYLGSGFDETPYGLVRISTDGGATFRTLMRLQGSAPDFYPENVTVGGVRGKDIMVAFNPAAMTWNIDEISLVAHGAVSSTGVAGTIAIRPSENPVRRSDVFLSWPFDTPTGTVRAFDFAGHLVWSQRVTSGERVRWDLAASHVANGVYLVVAQCGGRTVQLKLFVARTGA